MTHNTNSYAFFEQTPVFSVEDFSEFLHCEPHDRKRAYSRLNHFVRTGRVKKVARSVYSYVPFSKSVDTHYVDPYVIASKSAPDSVIAYHSALTLHGLGHTVSNFVHSISKHRLRHTPLGSQRIVFHSTPTFLLPDNHFFGTEQIQIDTTAVTITNKERTLVDIVRVPKHALGLEEVLNCAAWYPNDIDYDFIASYLALIGQSKTYSSVGWLLTRLRDTFEIPEQFLDVLHDKKSSSRFYLNCSPGDETTLVKDWNVFVPEYVQRLEIQ